VSGGYKEKNKTKDLVKLSDENRLGLQFNVLKDWDNGLVTGRQAIKRIIELEDIIFISRDDLNKVGHGKIHRQENK
jgi:hypothetical protein